MIAYAWIQHLLYALLCIKLGTSLKTRRISNHYRSNTLLDLVQRSNDVSVFDGVLSEEQTIIVDTIAATGGLGHSLFCRNQRTSLTPVESVIESILRALNDPADIVEYWFRDEWFSLEAHRDIDEKLYATDKSTFRYPESGHVLYLYAGEEVRGPTLIWQDVLEDDHTANSFNQVTVVPAVEGRLLRFPGNRLHAVPRPALAYVDPEEGGENIFLWSRKGGFPNYKRIEKSVYCKSLTDRRSVLLFNTWKSSPMDIPDEPPEGSVELWGKLRCMSKNSINTSNSIADTEIKCNPRSQWTSILPVHYSLLVATTIVNEMEGGSRNQEESTDLVDWIRNIRLKVGLLGDKTRRRQSERYMNLYSPAIIKQALESAHQPTTLPIFTLP